MRTADALASEGSPKNSSAMARHPEADASLWTASNKLAGEETAAMSYLNGLRRRSGIDNPALTSPGPPGLPPTPPPREQRKVPPPPPSYPKPTPDIDWTPRASSSGGVQQIFDSLAGPGGTKWEIGLTACAMIGTMAVCHACALPTGAPPPAPGLVESLLSSNRSPSRSTWTTSQYALAMTIALIDGSAAVQTSTGQNKRHWQPGGRLTRRAAALIVAEAVGQCVLIGYTFADGGPDAPLRFGLATGGFFLWALIALWIVPMHAQRPLSVLLFLAALALSSDGTALLPRTPGLQWARVVLPAKYILSHPVRHEPYRDAAW